MKQSSSSKCKVKQCVNSLQLLAAALPAAHAHSYTLFSNRYNSASCTAKHDAVRYCCTTAAMLATVHAPCLLHDVLRELHAVAVNRCSY
eukprot:12637-Heterococcus_DN1.PRE.3